MHYANNTHEIPFLTHSDALCGGFRKLRLQENYIWKQPESCDASTSLAESSYQRRSAAQWEYAKATRRWQHWHPLLDSCMLWWIYPRELDWIEENYIGKRGFKKVPCSLWESVFRCPQASPESRSRAWLFGIEEDWMKYLENGEYLCAVEISAKQNYNMIDGKRNNIETPKEAKPGRDKTSLLERLK